MTESPSPGEAEIIPLNEESRVISHSDENQLAVVPTAGNESQVALPAGEDDRKVAVQIPSFNLKQGTYIQPNFGPQSRHIEANKIEHATITHHHHHDHHHYSGKDGKSSEEPSTSGPPQAKGGKEETSEENEEYAKISDDIFIYSNQPLREGARIYKGYQQHASGVRRPLAIKMIVPCTDNHVREVQHLVNLASHRNVVQIIHSTVTKGVPRILYIAMELCRFQNLQDYLDENREQNTPFDFKKTMSFTKQLIRAMMHIHRYKIVHRDIKPENILLSFDKDQLKVADFGLGKQLRHGCSRTKTRTGGQGTDGYIAPEVYDTGEISRETDVFSLGITFHNLWTNGKHPFGRDVDLRVHNIKNNKGRDYSGLLIFGPKRDQFLDLIGKMVQHDPRLRPTMQEIFDHPFLRDETSSSVVALGQTGLDIREEDLPEEQSENLEVSEQNVSPTVTNRTRTTIFGPLAKIFRRSRRSDRRLEPENQSTSAPLAPSVPDITSSAPGHLHVAAVEERARHLIKASKFSEVISLLKDLPPSKNQQMMLAESYLQSEEWEKARNAMDALKTILASSTMLVAPSSIIRLVDCHISDSSHIKALILLPSASYLYRVDKNPNDAVQGLLSCSFSCCNVIKAFLKQGGRMRVIAINIGCEIILQIFADMQSVTGVDKSTSAEKKASCLFNIGKCYRLIGEPGKAIEYHMKGIEIMKSQFDSNNPKKLLGFLLNNVAACHESLLHYRDAKFFYLEAIKIKKFARDYENVEEKWKDVSMSQQNLQTLRGKMGRY